MWYNEVMVKKSGRRKALRKQTYGRVYDRYLQGKLKLTGWQKVGILMLIVVIAGFAGWVWEFMLQEVDGGFRHFYIKGGNLLPWINIYAYGAVLVILLTYRLRKYPWAVFVVAAVACGLLEWFAGWAVYTVGNGTRYWNYMIDWWGAGSIDGFVCPVSMCAFGLGALALMYWLLPSCIYLAQKMSKRDFLILAIVLFATVMVDDLTNLTLKNLGLPTAMDFYESIGFRYLHKSG